MARFSLVASDGVKLADGIYHLPFLGLLGCHDMQSLLPSGSFVFASDLEKSGWSGIKNGIYLSLHDLMPLPRSGRYNGCCGPDGDLKNILGSKTLEPIAFEFSDCWGPHYANLAEGEFTLIKESAEQPECFVGYVQYKDDLLLVGVAVGKNKSEALERLIPLSQKQLKQENDYLSEFYPIADSPIEIMDAKSLLARIADEKPLWLFRKY